MNFGGYYMKVSRLQIKNFKSIRELLIEEMDYACILVGKNNTGKTVVLEAIRALTGDYLISSRDFNDKGRCIEIAIELEITTGDLMILYKNGLVSKYRNYAIWERDFREKMPSYQDGILRFTYVVHPDGQCFYEDGVKKNNFRIQEILPKIYYIDHTRNVVEMEKDFLSVQTAEEQKNMSSTICMFDMSKHCQHCFQCIGIIYKKTPKTLSAIETAKLLEYKLYQTNMEDFSSTLNKCFRINSGKNEEIQYRFDFDIEKVFHIETMLHSNDSARARSIHELGAGTKSIYLLSLLEAYIAGENCVPSIIILEEPEIYLHPQLQKAAGKVLYKLSKKNQVIFSTHSPNMLFNFSSKQIKQIILDRDYYTICKEDEEIDEILDDLGYAANDLMNVSFVFIVEGKQDRSRLPLILEKYYSEIYTEDGKLQRISIITTNSCTNIKTYANLKYMNQLYLKDQFLMIRDSDGKKPEYLVKQLCNYYSNRADEDKGAIPRVTPRNVLVLKYYSFENYFLNPTVMAQIGIVKSEEEFYNILYQKFKDYLYRLPSVRRMQRVIGKRINSVKDIKENMESFRIFVRGHNLYDIFYGRYRGEEETEILRRYISIAPRETFRDILDAIDRFVYFENRKRIEE